MKGYQLSCKGRYLSFSESKVIFNGVVYLNKESITEDVINRFKDICCDGGGIYDLDRESLIIKINEIEIIS